MIIYLKGKVREKENKYLVIEVNSIGYQVFVIPLWLEEIALGQELEINTFLYCKEDTQELYGFKNKEELIFFKYLISISGIGPKSALGVLSLASPQKLREAISQEKVEILTKVSGIGKKTAERIIIELKSKIEKEGGEIKSADEEVIDALMGLGYSLKESRGAMKKVSWEIEGSEKRLKAALKNLGR